MQRMTTATNGSVDFRLFICVLTPIPDGQQPYPGCEWYSTSRSRSPPAYPGADQPINIELCTKRFAYFLRLLDVLDHVLIRLVRRVDARLRALNGQGERVHDHYGVSNDLPLHEPHDFPWYTGACMYDLCHRRPISMRASIVEESL